MTTGKSPVRTIAPMTLCFGIAVLLAPLLREVTFLQGLAYVSPFWLGFVVMLLLFARGRIRITANEVQVRSWRGTCRIPRGAIAQVFYTRNLLVAGMPGGYIALLDDDGKPLWRSTSSYWRPETIQALLGAGRGHVVLDSLTPSQARTWWPHLLTWQLANPRKAALAGVGGLVLVTALAAVLVAELVN